MYTLSSNITGGILDLDDHLVQNTVSYTTTANRELLYDTEFWKILARISKAKTTEDLKSHPGADLMQKSELWIEDVDPIHHTELHDALECFRRDWGEKIGEIFARTAPKRFELCPGAKDLVQHFDRLDREFVILTNNQECIAREILDRSGLNACSPALISANDVKNKPDPEGHFSAAEFLNMPLQYIISMGDNVNDMRAAIAAGIAGILVNPNPDILQGTELECHPAVTHITSLEELVYQ